MAEILISAAPPTRWREPFNNTKKRTIARPLQKPSKAKSERIALVLDLDECLVHSFHLKNAASSLSLRSNDNSSFSPSNYASPSSSPATSYRQREYRPVHLNAYLDSFTVVTELGDTFRVNKRPGLDSFLRIAVHFFDLYVFSAAQETYVRPVIKQLDPQGKIFKGVFFRQHCVPSQRGAFMKNLELVRPNLSRVVLVDNNPASVVLQPRNAIPVSSFFDDDRDRELQCVLDVLMKLREEEDVREALHAMFKLENKLSKYREELIHREQRSVIKRFVEKMKKMAAS